MRLSSGFALGTMATFAVMLVALSVGAGAYGPHSTGAVRTTASGPTVPTSHAAISHSAHAAIGSPASAVRPSAPLAPPPPVNVTLTSIAIAPNTTQTLAPGGNVGFTASWLCTVNGTANQTCPYPVALTWANAAPDLGTFNSTNQSTATYSALWNALGTDAVTVSGSFNNTTAWSNVTSAPVTVNVFASGAPIVTVTYSTAFTLYMKLPFTVSWNISVTNGSIASSSTWVTLNVRDISGNCGSLFGLGPVCPTVVNLSQKVSSGQTAYSQVLNVTNLNSAGYATASPGGAFPRDEYQLLVWATENNSVANRTFAGQQNVYPVFQAPSGVFVSPLPGSYLSTGNVTFVVTYTGDYIQGVTLQVTNVANQQIVFVSPMFVVGTGNRTIGAGSPWLAATAGSYVASILVTTPYGINYINQTMTVVPAGQTIYVNHTSTQTESLPGGLSAAVTATILLVVGLIIGLIVALVLGRMMWGAPMQPASPQPWSPNQGSGGSSGGSMDSSSSSTDSSSGNMSSGDTSMKK
ncbi:MAG: hypothetical protein ACHQ16_03630 [Candidatus Lutacidiplasmatales archaeon]